MNPIAAAVKDLYAEGLPLKRIATSLDVSYSFVRKVIYNDHQIPDRYFYLTSEQETEIAELADGYSVREIARRVNCSKTTAHRRLVWIREKSARQRCEISVRRLNRPRRCEKHGLLTVWPCIACAAIDSMQTK